MYEIIKYKLYPPLRKIRKVLPHGQKATTINCICVVHNFEWKFYFTCENDISIFVHPLLYQCYNMMAHHRSLPIGHMMRWCHYHRCVKEISWRIRWCIDITVLCLCMFCDLWLYIVRKYCTRWSIDIIVLCSRRPGLCTFTNLLNQNKVNVI